MAHSPSDKPSLVLRSYEKKVRRITSGRYVTQKLNQQGKPFIVFCSNEFCPAYLYAEGALPYWTEDCEVKLGVVRCPLCGAPMVRPDSPLDRQVIET